MNGYVMLPCFTVYVDEYEEVHTTCSRFLEWIFENFFMAFWDGKVVITDE